MLGTEYIWSFCQTHTLKQWLKTEFKPSKSLQSPPRVQGSISTLKNKVNENTFNEQNENVGLEETVLPLNVRTSYLPLGFRSAFSPTKRLSLTF